MEGTDVVGVFVALGIAGIPIVGKTRVLQSNPRLANGVLDEHSAAAHKEHVLVHETPEIGKVVCHGVHDGCLEDSEPDDALLFRSGTLAPVSGETVLEEPVEVSLVQSLHRKN